MTYYTLDAQKANAVAALMPPLTPADVIDMCCADWPEGDEHQQWLDQTPAPEIARWLETFAISIQERKLDLQAT